MKASSGLGTRSLALVGISARGFPLTSGHRLSQSNGCNDYSTETNSCNLLDELVNYERSGIPAAAGTTASSRFDLGRMHRLLAALGNPHLGVKAVHVAGSKGKGSTATLLATALTAAGYRPGLYTSPHLLALEERIAVGHPGGSSPRPRPIPSDDLAFLMRRHAAAIRERAEEEDGALSHFEVVTALAFRYFADCSVDLAVLETGLGGITDATNVVPEGNLQAAVITALGLEHVEALGGSLASIAAAKAGILRRGRPLVLAPQSHPEAASVVLREARERGCPVTRVEQSVLVRSLGLELDPHRRGLAASERLSLTLLPEEEEEEEEETQAAGRGAAGAGPGSGSGAAPEAVVGAPGGSHRQSLEVRVGLVGPHQHVNVATAVATVRVLRRRGWRLPDEALAAGLREAHLPGRFQVVKLPGSDGPYVVLDGAHTADSAAALAASMRAAFPGVGAGGSGAAGQQQQRGPPVALLLAMASDKDHRAVVAALREGVQPRVAVFTSVPIAGSYRRAAAPGTLAGHWQAAAILAPPSQRPLRCRELVQASLMAAFDKARQELRGLRAASGGGSGAAGAGGTDPGIILVTGSLHAVAEAHKIPELQPLLRD